MTTFSLKNVKTMQGREGMAYTATVYMDGKKVGTVHDEGNGGSPRAYWDGPTSWQNPDFCQWVVDNCTGHWSEEYVNRDEVVSHNNEELGFAILIDRWDLARLAKKGVLFRVNEATYTMKCPVMEPAALADINTRHPGAEVYVPTTAMWVPVTELVG